MSVGLLSQTYLEAVNAETILVPSVSWALNTEEMIDTPDSKTSLDCICQFSVFKSQRELLDVMNQKIKGWFRIV